jgi:hypothetical protein
MFYHVRNDDTRIVSTPEKLDPDSPLIGDLEYAMLNCPTFEIACEVRGWMLND